MGNVEIAELLLRMNEKTHLGFSGIDQDQSGILAVLKPSGSDVELPGVDEKVTRELALYDGLGREANI